MLHLALDEFLKLFRLLWHNIEEKLVVYLKRHLRLEFEIADKLIDLQHRQLDKVRSSSLQRSVDGSALRKAAHVRIPRLNVWNRANPAKVCLDGLLATHGLKRLLDEPLNPLVAVEVGLDILLRGLLIDVELRSQPKRADAVDDAEVDSLRARARLFTHRRNIDTKDLACSKGMNVLTSPVSIEQQRILREVSHQTQFDLGIVGRHENIARSRNERRTDLASERSANGNVLQVRIGRRQTPGRSSHLIEGRMNPTLCVGELRK